MNDEPKKYLQDIINAIVLIDGLVIETHDFSFYQNDKKTKSAVERQLEIIGEASNKYRKFEGLPDLSNSKHIINFRKSTCAFL